MSYRLYVVRLFCFDWKTTVDFYASVLDLPMVYENETLGWAQFAVGDSHLGVERCEPGDPEAEALVGRFAGVSLAVDDVYHTYRCLVDNGVEFSGEPEVQPWGGVLAHFKDPAGNIITLLSAANS